MRLVFADTSFWIALIHRSDSLHEQALRLDTAWSDATIVSTDEVLTEFLAYFSANPARRQRAVSQVDDLLQRPGYRVLPQSRTSFRAGLDLYRARPDKGYSLVDCISMQTMRALGIREVLTNDRHFAQEGFTALFQA